MVVIEDEVKRQVHLVLELVDEQGEQDGNGDRDLARVGEAFDDYLAKACDLPADRFGE